MKGQKLLKITGILMIIAAVFSIFSVIFIGGMGTVAAGTGAASQLTWVYWSVLVLTLVGGICQMIAGVMGIKHCARKEMARTLLVWGVVVIVLRILGVALDLLSGYEIDIVGTLAGAVVPVLYIYGAVLNSKEGSTPPTI